MLAITVNSCNFSGHLVAKPTLREVAGKALATFALGQTRRYKKPDGTMAESTVFVDCTTLAQHLLFPRGCCARVVRGVRGAIAP